MKFMQSVVAWFKAHGLLLATLFVMWAPDLVQGLDLLNLHGAAKTVASVLAVLLLYMKPPGGTPQTPKLTLLALMTVAFCLTAACGGSNLSLQDAAELTVYERQQDDCRAKYAPDAAAETSCINAVRNYWHAEWAVRHLWNDGGP